MRRRGQQIGRFDKRIKFQYQTRVSDGMGGYTNTWTDDLTVWADIQPMTGREQLSEGRLDSSQQFKVYLRYTNDFNSELDTHYRIVYLPGSPNEKVFNIHSVENPGLDREFYVITAFI